MLSLTDFSALLEETLTINIHSARESLVYNAHTLYVDVYNARTLYMDVYIVSFSHIQ